MLRFAHSPLNISKILIEFAFAVRSKLSITFSFTVTFMKAHARYFVTRSVIFLTANKSAEYFDCLSNVELLRLFLFGLSDAPI